MKNLFLLNRLGFNPDLTTRQSRVDSVSNPCRCRVLAILLLFFTLGAGNAWATTAFEETFASCDGTLGWSGTAANGTFTPDNDGWTVANAYGAGGAARFGTSSKKGTAQTPAINCGSATTATLTFKAGAWNGGSEQTTLNLTYTNCSGDKSSVTMVKGSFTSYSVALSSISGNIKIQFAGKNTSNSRFLLDDVVVTYTAGASYTVTYADGGATSGSVPTDASSPYSSGATVTVLDNTENLEKTGYTFNGWSGDNGIGAKTAGQTFTMPSANVTLTAQWEALPNYTVTFNAGSGTCGTSSFTQTAVNRSTTLPTATPSCTGWSFAGWCTSSAGSADENSSSPGTILTGSYTPENNVTLYAVYTKTEGGGGSATLTKLGSGYSPAAGDNLVIVGNGQGKALYQETVSTSYVNYWDFSNDVDVVQADAKNYITLESDGDDGWYFGDATNGYIYNASSNDLTADTGGSNKTSFTITWNSTGFNITANSRWFSCRSDLTGGNKYKFRMGGATSGGGSGTILFDLYKYVAGGGSTTYYMTNLSCAACDKQVNITKGTPESGGSFDLDKTGSQNCCSNLVVTVSNIVAPAGKQFSAITQSGIAAGNVTIDNSAKTVTYAANSTGSSTINVTFEAIPTYTVTWSANGETFSSQNGVAGTELTNPGEPTSANCDGTKVFVGWTETEINGETDTEPGDLFSSAEATSKTIPSSNKTYYAVFANIDGAGGWGRLTSSNLSELADGDRIVIVSTVSGSSGTLRSIEKVGDNNGISIADVPVETDGKISNPSSDIIWTLHATGEEWEIKNGDDKLGSKYTNCPGSNGTGIYVEKGTKWTTWSIGSSSSGTDMIYIKNEGTTDCNLGLGITSSSWRIIKQSNVTSHASCALKVYKEMGSYSNYATACCNQPAQQLTMTADKTSLVRSGEVTFTLAGGNDKNITWSCVDEASANCDVLSATSNSGATLTISSPVSATKTYTVTATQPEDDADPDNVVCGKTVSIDITVKAQWTITFQTTDNSTLSTYSTVNVIDGESYTFPDLSDEYNCEDNYSFVGWKEANTAGAPEKTAGSSATASANKTWYAVWMHSNGSTKQTRDKYERMTNGSSIAANDVVVVAYIDGGVALAQMTTADEAGSPIAVDFADDYSYLTFAPGTDVMELKAIWHDDSNNDLDAWSLQDNAADYRLTYAGDKGGTLYYTDESGWYWDITITSQNNATIQDTEDGYDYALKYNTTRNVFAFYASGQKTVQLYRKNGTIQIDIPSAPTYYVDNTHCTNGATLRATGGQWITSANGQKVKTTIPVTAKNFETSGKQITATSDNAHFTVTVPSHTIPNNKSEVVVNLTVEYTPVAANTTENANITLTTGDGAGDATKVITVNGRSLPDEFVIISQKETKWYALPANMGSGAANYAGYEVEPNVGLTAVPAAPYTTIYTLREVATSRYADAGNYVRLVGNGNKCLWANESAGSGNTTIQNWATVSSTNGAQYEWELYTDDGETYTIKSPNHPHYATGRQLAINTLKYGLYKNDATFYLLPVGCTSQPGNLQIKPRRVDATFSWESNAPSVTIDLYTNEAMTTGHMQATVTDVPYFFSGLAESTQYWYKITPGTDEDCALAGTFTTTGPTIDIVEWQENAAVIYVDKADGLDPVVIVDGEVEHGQGGILATDIFFSKYFEAQEKAKMLAIFNGTGNAISLANITIAQRSTGTPLSLAEYGTVPGWIQPGEEIILFYPSSVNDIMKCAQEEESYEKWNNVSSKTGSSNLDFSGKGTIRLFRGDKCIDIIGAMGSGATVADMNNMSVAPIDGAASPSFGDAQGFVTDHGDNYSTDDIETNYELSTNRCLLIRQNWVTSGDSAVLNNFGDFKTLGTYTGVDSREHKGEWAGLQIPTGPSSDKYHYTCLGFKDVGVFDYSSYYKDYSNVNPEKVLSQYSHDDVTKEYTIPISNMAQYSCLNLRFQMRDPETSAVLTETPVQVPIIVNGSKSTTDAIFNQIAKDDEEKPLYDISITRCKTCNVVVLGSGTLTKATDGTLHDVPEVGNIKVYPGGKLIVPSETNYSATSLAFRRQEDVVSSANIQGALTLKTPNSVYLDVRIDPSNWHYFTLPYDCRVGDITFADGTPAKINSDYLIAWYDGAYRAEHKTGGWTDITDNEYILKKGLGYIVALPGSGSIRKEIRFPMANEVITQDLANKGVAGLYGHGCNKSDEELRPNHKGWNMIGNPYLTTYNTDFMAVPLATGTLVHSNTTPWDGTWIIEAGSESLRYIVEPIDNGWSGYRQTTINNMQPFTSYFVQIGGSNPETERTIEFKATSVKRSIVARRNVQEEEDTHPVWYGIEMTAPNSEKDNTTLLISNDFTDGYDMMDDLAKQRGSYYQYYQYPVLASRNNEGEMAFNALPDSSAADTGVPLNFYAAQEGTYTIATDSRYDLEEVKSAMLHDVINNTWTDLLENNYEFYSDKGDNTNRFMLYVRVERKKAPEVATGNDNLLDGKLSLIAIDKTLVLSGLTDAADIYVYDMSGKMIKSEHGTGNGIWRATVPATGVYFVRVNGAAGQQTLRTVVK